MPPKEPDALVAGILRLMRDPKLRQVFGDRGQALAAHYSWDNVAHQVMSYYERLLYERRQVAEVRLAASEVAAAAEAASS